MRAHGFAFRVRTRDHNPPHVHAVGTEGEVVVIIETATAWRVEGRVRQAEVNCAEAVVAEHRDRFRAAWEQATRQVSR
ncbi:MAG TPA: DUF4160 domain-containing protein [Longimicrobium sp.]|nr:DUF4160 domain-containing protein [Longimicrobium sp.]